MSIERQYVNAIYNKSQIYANWDPTNNSFKIGDYGKINSQTGRFEKKGNLFDETFQNVVHEVGKPSPGTHIFYQHYLCGKVECVGGTIDIHVAQPKSGTQNLYQHRVKCVGGNLDVTISGDIIRGRADVHFQFSKSFGAVLALANVMSLVIPRRGHIRALVKAIQEDEAFRKKIEKSVIITSIYRSSTYSILAGKSNGEQVGIFFIPDSAGWPLLTDGRLRDPMAGSELVSKTGSSRNRDGLAYTPLLEISILNPTLLRRLARQWSGRNLANAYREDDSSSENQLFVRAPRNWISVG